ncbi:acyltransferase 3 [Treponema primitia ZAS-2]|uniref:Acyltransferase 3 n=1 Tax=Treponema primitia (strain ATCC BAA-887 / DSM 12427 / ZAS-2) TaxID=545694 RepID=F5YP09_TREPZ|nr:acyltransferase [Treponema primitia]AEF85764.1 acyltransferase 3 [Treponema primitia ZAS-2]
MYNEATNLLLKKKNVSEYIIGDISKNNNINFLRLLLAYMVVIFHSMSLSGNKYPLGKLFDGHIAVCGFFIISGFLIIRSYWSSKCLKDYLIKRCKRLLPAYCFVIIICMVGLSLMSNLSAEEYFRSQQLIKYFIANIFFMNFLYPSLPGVFSGNPVNGSLWTIKLEIGFYIIVPIIAYILNKCKTKKRINIFLACLYLSGYIYNFICLYMAKKMENRFIEELAHQLPGFIQYFAVGIFCVINYNFVRKYDKFLIIPGIIILVLYYTIGNEYLLPIGLGIIIMYIGFNFNKLNNIGKNEDYSFGVYIYHFPVIQILITLGYFKLNKYITLIIVMGTVFCMAYISWNMLEMKFLKR